MTIVVIALTAVIALLIGLLLFQYSQRTSQVQFKGSGAGLPAAPRVEASIPKVLMPAILEQLKELPASAQQRQRVARTVSDIVTKTVEHEVGAIQQKLTAQFGEMIEEKRRTAAVLQQKYQETLVEKKQTAAVLESIAEGLVVINNKGEVVMMNPAAEKLLGVAQKERVGRPLAEELKDEQLISMVSDVGGEGREIVLTAKQDATKKVLRASNAMITDENGKTVGMVAVLSDVTKQREIDQLKSDFVSTVSHELRTPIVAMKHALSILIDQVAGPLTNEQKNFTSIVQRNLDRLNTLINDLLDLSKLEAKKMELRLESGSLTSVIQTACESLGPWAASKSITLTRRVADGLPDVMLDPFRITQVLTNLIGNAVKFTPNQGRVTIEARPSKEGNAIEVSVADTGVGIAKEDLPKLFTKFQQLGERSTTDIGGTGLGLVIAKEIVELHHGRIWAESDSQRGAKFTFTLPLMPVR
jgi:PAS domain S-box-containing protein